MSHTDKYGTPLDIGATVQMDIDPTVGTNTERWYGWIESADERYVYVIQDCWYDIYGDRHELGGKVVKVHPDNLRRLF